MRRHALGVTIFAITASLPADRSAAQSTQLFGPGLPNSTCGLQYGAPPTPCESTYALQVEALARRPPEPVPADAPCGTPELSAADRKRIAMAFLDAARARTASGGTTRIAAALLGAVAEGVAAHGPPAIRTAIAHNFEPQPKHATCGALMVLLPAGATLVGYDFTETGNETGTGSCFSEAGCLNGDTAFDGAPEMLAKDASAQVIAAQFRNWSTQDRTARMLLFFTLPPNTPIQLAR
jgi:hypothetical protein